MGGAEQRLSVFIGLIALFVSPAWGSDGDYHVRDGSLAIDAGTPTGAPSKGLDGAPRPQGAGYDIGAYERG